MEQTLIREITNILKGRSIFLIGMMACGKSETGPKLAQLLNYKFIDLDSSIEKVANKSITNIFKQDGEKIFRDYETKCLQEIIKFPSLVIATGGGIVIKNENWGILRQGIVVWIDLDKETALKRLSQDSNKRPLLNTKDLNKHYSDIFKKRINLYNQADLRIQVSNENVDQVAEQIIVEIKKNIS